MDRVLYIASSGAEQVMKIQSVNANNLANVTTPGFREDLASMTHTPVYGNSHGTRVFAVAEQKGINFNTGNVQTTGNDLDIAIKGKGLITVAAKDGTEAYTRAGNLQITSTGQLLTGDGNPVIGNGGPIAVPPFDKIDIGADGTISIVPKGSATTTLAVIDRIKLVNPDPKQLVKNEQGLLKLANGTPAEADATVRVASGALESSNVNAIGSMVSMMEMARFYEVQVKLMKEAKDNDQATSKLMSLS